MGVSHANSTVRRAILALAAAFLTFGAPVATAAFPGSNGPIFFTNSEPGVSAMNPDGSGVKALGPGARAKVSRDGRRVVFHRPTGSGADIFVMNVDGSEVKQLTTTGKDSDATWSPDGARIAFTSRRDGEAKLWTMAADGSGQAVLVGRGPGLCGAPPPSPPNPCPPTVYGEATWSPDGTTIVFAGSLGSGPELFAVPSGGGTARQLTNGGGGENFPDFSPDGSRIAFGGPFAPQSTIEVINADGSGRRALASKGMAPSWSPDGTKIAFERATGIFTMNANGGGERSTGLVRSRRTPNWATCPPSGPCTLPGGATSGADVFRGTSGPDVFKGGAGADRISGEGGADLLCGEAGNDSLTGGAGADRLYGELCAGAASARLVAGAPAFTAAKAGNNKLSGGAGNDKIYGGAGNDTISVGGGKNSVSAGGGKDSINARNKQRDTVNCGRGVDSVRADRADKLTGCEKRK